MKTREYRINEMFASPQGEGARAGRPSLFVRFAGCNLRCTKEPGPRSPGGFDCDTEFMSGTRMTADQILADGVRLWNVKYALHEPWVIFTGGEPMLQLDDELVAAFQDDGWHIAIETNGTRAVPAKWALDWIVVSPKVAEHALRQTTAHEVRYVRGIRQALPRTRIVAERYFLSPAFDGTELDAEALEWCRKLSDDSMAFGGPRWELSVQQHKLRGER